MFRAWVILKILIIHIIYNSNRIEKMIEFKQAFDLCDVNRDGRIEKSELVHYFEKLSIPISEKEINAMMQIADCNENGFIEFDEFVKMMSI